MNKEWRTITEVGGRAVAGWMNSPGHRKNILNAEFSVGGIGIAVVNDYVIITQNFREIDDDARWREIFPGK